MWRRQPSRHAMRIAVCFGLVALLMGGAGFAESAPEHTARGRARNQPAPAQAKPRPAAPAAEAESQQAAATSETAGAAAISPTASGEAASAPAPATEGQQPAAVPEPAGAAAVPPASGEATSPYGPTPPAPAIAPYEEARPGEPVALGSLALDIGAKLAAVIGLIFLCALAWRKLAGGAPGLAAGTARPVELVQSLPLGPGRALHLVRVRSRELVLGSTPQQVNLLVDLADPGAVTDRPGAFAEALSAVSPRPSFPSSGMRAASAETAPPEAPDSSRAAREGISGALTRAASLFRSAG
ncbi:MAG: FliO/MopB family protein [Armatimonadetes bacterium]|nr:FliO/MopB family protein [Armatimonadota bacterium]